MRLITPHKVIQRNVKIGQYAFGGGMILLLAAFAINLYALGQPNNPELVVYAFGTFILGFTLTNIGTVFNNRWGRRSDRGLADALKGLDDRYSLYNHHLGAEHVLVGPHGVTVLLPKYQTGAIAYAGGKWANPGAPRGFLGLGARDPLGNPSAEAASEAENLKSFFKKRLPEMEVAPQPLIVFMSPRAEVSARESPVQALHAKQLKDHIRRLPKGASLSAQALAGLDQKLGLAAEGPSG